MPGIKRRASQLPSAEKPPKLKKQSTSATTATAKGKVEKKKKPNQVDSLDSPPKLEKISAVNSPRKLASPGKKSPEKKYKMPRFPTLKPTKPSSDAEGFSISAPSFYSKSSPSTNFTKLKTDSTIKLDSKKPENKLNNDKETCLTSEATEILPPQLEIEVDPSFTRASEIEKKMQKLPSGSIVGKITNLEFDDLILPLEASEVIYEFSDESSSPTYGASKITSGGLQSRASAFEVAEYLTSLDKSSSENTLEEPLTKIEEEISETVDEEQVKTDKEVEENLDKPDKESSDEDSDRPVQDTVDYSDDDDSDKTEDKEESKQETKTSETASPVKTPRKVPGGLREIVFSFDTTGSMYNYMEEAGERIRDLVKRLQNEMPGIRLAFMAHGDYYDLSHDRYLIKWIDFGASIEEVVKFFDNLSITHGGDDDECYELVLRKTRESLSWTPGSQRSLVLIGDSDPHEPGYKYEQFVNDIDWRVETALLKEMGIRIYGLQVGYRSDFYKQISKITGGAHLRLDNASFTYETLMSICLREGTLKLLKSYENEVRKAKKQSEKGGILDLELERLFSSLKSVEDNKSTKTMLKEQKQALKEEKKAKKALELEAKGEKRPAESGDESSPAKKVKGEKKSPPKVPGKFKNAATARILSKAKRTIIEKKIVKTSPVKKGTKDDSSDDQEEDSKSKVKTKGRVKQIKTSPKNSPKSVKKSVKSGSVVQNDSPKKKDSEKKKPGRPSKTQSDVDKKTGRPPKSKASNGKKKPGRPAKVQEKEKKKPKSQNESEKKKPGRPSKSAPSASSKEKKADDKEKVKGKVMKSKTRGVQPKRSESKTSKSVQSSKSSPAAKNSPGKITKPKVSPRVNNKKATLLKKSVKDTTNSVVKKQEKTQVAKKTEKSTPVNKTKSESKTPKKAQKAEKTSPKSKASPKVSKPVKKQPRETAAVTKFVMGPLSVLSWENWLPLITHTKPDVKTEDWKRKPSVSPGFCNDKVYNGEMSQAVYEIAVSPPDSTKRYPVYYAVDALWSCFASPHVKKEVERIIKAKGSISVRKGSMGKPNDAVFQKAVDFMKLNFDYAWDGRGEDVKKDGFVIARGT